MVENLNSRVNTKKKLKKMLRKFQTLQKTESQLNCFFKMCIQKIIYLYMYIDENNPKYIFDDIFALLLHLNKYTS